MRMSVPTPHRKAMDSVEAVEPLTSYPTLHRARVPRVQWGTNASRQMRRTRLGGIS